MNIQLSKRLQYMRQAQDDIDTGKFSKEDEKAIRYLAANIESYKHKPLEVAVMLLKQQYHSMKNTYLSLYPSQPIISRNIVHGIKEIYGHILDEETTK